MRISETIQEIKHLTSKLIKSGLSISERQPVNSNNKVIWEGHSDISIALKNVPYIEKYNVFSNERNYNIKMLDGALIQIMYEFNSSGRRLLSHRLAFFPSPIIDRYDDIPEEYENYRYVNSEFHDMIEKHIVSFPIRFDYNENSKFFIPVTHPYAHVSLGEYENCRIAVNAPLTPSIFMNFIISNFYSYAIKNSKIEVPISTFRFNNRIVNEELGTLHLNII